MTALEQRNCAPCRGGVEPLEAERIAAYAALLDRQWMVIDAHHLQREYRFANFREALDFVNRVGELHCGHTRSTGCTRTISFWRPRSIIYER